MVASLIRKSDIKIKLGFPVAFFDDFRAIQVSVYSIAYVLGHSPLLTPKPEVVEWNLIMPPASLDSGPFDR